MGNARKLHLGCGSKNLEGWINIDSVAENNPDVVLDIAEPLPYPDLSVDEILAEDLLEHFDKYARFLVFYQWVRVLKIGGKVIVQVPNFKKILIKYFKFKYADFVDFLFGENLWEAKVYIGHFGNHKWGYSKESLLAFVKQFGISNIKLESKGLNLRLIGIKASHMTEDELGEIKVHSHNNRFGSPKLYDVPMSFVREKIKFFQENNHKHHARS